MKDAATCLKINVYTKLRKKCTFAVDHSEHQCVFNVYIPTILKTNWCYLTPLCYIQTVHVNFRFSFIFSRIYLPVHTDLIITNLSRSPVVISGQMRSRGLLVLQSANQKGRVSAISTSINMKWTPKGVCLCFLIGLMYFWHCWHDLCDLYVTRHARGQKRR